VRAILITETAGRTDQKAHRPKTVNDSIKTGFSVGHLPVGNLPSSTVLAPRESRTMSSFSVIIGPIAGAMSIVAVIPYIISTLHGETKPHRITWWILSLLGLIMSATHFAAGGGSTVWVPLCGAIGQLLIAILSLRYGEGGWGHLDRFCLAGVATSVVLWQQLDSPILALGLTIAIDFLGCLPTIQKAWQDPESEDFYTWFVYSLSSGLNLFAIHQWTFAIALLPIYLFGCTTLITGLLVNSHWRALEQKYRFIQGVKLFQYDRVLLFQLNGPMVLKRSHGIERGRLAMRTANSIVIDLTNVPFLGWRSARKITATVRYAHQQGLQIYIVGPSPKIHRQLGRSGIFNLVRSQDCIPDSQTALKRAMGRLKGSQQLLTQPALQLF
jgi:anti-anti-sigma regulatory factor/type IV secretory pathway VirB2 component (pilin)